MSNVDIALHDKVTWQVAILVLIDMIKSLMTSKGKLNVTMMLQYGSQIWKNIGGE